ncbi:MAG TPA: exodeoxyribonuclease VII small subunit [Deltaproteobacteria bacterium]|nr:exodeoxyribonuclease VII small subunit [Deltaproteobacteria bacterium]
MKKSRSYSEALQDLEKYLDKLNKGEVPIDKLESTVRSAAETIKFLRQKLRSTQTEITGILKDIEDDDSLETKNGNQARTQ